MPDRAALNQVLACNNLPSLPMVGVQVLTLTRNPDVSMDQIAKVIENDPALSAKVLRTVNSSMYGLKAPCTTIRRALNYLGLSAVKSIVLGFSLVESTRGCSGGSGFNIDDHWRRTIFASAATRVMAAHVRVCDPDEAFAASLFQDLGGLAMYVALGPAYTDAISADPLNHGRHVELETAALGFSHAEAGAALANKWKLPDRYVQTIMHHHAPDGAGADARGLVRVVGLGAMIAQALMSTNPTQDVPRLLGAAKHWFGLPASEMVVLFKQIGQASVELGKLFDKRVGQVPDTATLMREANDELMQQHMQAMREAETLRERNNTLLKQTITDALTGIGNRKHFQDESARLYEESTTIGRPLVLLMLDGDKFKSVNDTHGHHVGDAVLKELAGRISKAVGDLGVACRYGGEEFAVLLPGTTLDEGRELAESVRRAICGSEFDLSSIENAPKTLPVSVSIGVACNDPSGNSGYTCFTSQIEAADKALYTAKHNGRNRVCVEKAPVLEQAAPVPSAEVAAAVQPPQGAAPRPVVGAGPKLAVPTVAGAKPAAPVAGPAKTRAGLPGASGPIRVLLLEDDPLSARMIMALLQKTPNLEIEWLRQAPKGIARIAETAASGQRLHLVICDYGLTGGDGLSILKALRSTPEYVGLPFALCTASEEAELGQQAIDCGASAFISKDNIVQQLPQWVARQIGAAAA